MSDVRIGVIGGSGLYEMEGLRIQEERKLETPFGDPSDAYIIGELEGKRVAFLPRHGRGHRLLPSELNYRANLYGMKVLGVEWIVSVSAVGSLKEGYAPTDILIPDQFFDRTRHRPDTFFGNGLVAHVSFAHPICGQLAEWMAAGSRSAGATVHEGGVYVCMEGPMFSTLAESLDYRRNNFDVVGMTNLQEARLAREAEMSYATMAMVTDYDCWHEEEEDVSGAAVMEVIRQNVHTAQEAVRRTIRLIDDSRHSPFKGILRHALITDPSLVPADTLEALAPIVSRYLRS
ncbi:MAG: S-methyl-5'-thioadenosine phosphorylase [Acidobacteria bacterium]|nr:S-methyl-5'-thioadenosine phosphorylase [Acidobacteriota bacterium]